MTISVQPVRGTRDYLPQEVKIREKVKEIIRRSYENSGFSMIETPLLENIELLDKSEGGENLNMIFRILKRGRKFEEALENNSFEDLADMGLRFDLTLPLSRYYANNRSHLKTPFKVIQIGQVFRAERPQKGRLRQFYQCDIDIIGDASERAEIELMDTTAKTLQKLGFEDFTIRVNDRRILFDMIEHVGFPREEVISVCISFDKLDKIGLEGVESELLEKGYDGEVVSRFVKAIADSDGADVSDMVKYCSDPGPVNELQHIIDSVRKLADGKYKVEYDKSLVRGMGYYTGTIFEAVSPKFGSSIAGGGRYDKMIGNLTGEDVPAVGFSIGFERICEIILSSPEMGFDRDEKQAVLLYEPEDDFLEVMKKGNELRDEGFDVNLTLKARKLGKQLSSLEEEGYNVCVIFGEEGRKEWGI